MCYNIGIDRSVLDNVTVEYERHHLRLVARGRGYYPEHQTSDGRPCEDVDPNDPWEWETEPAFGVGELIARVKKMTGLDHRQDIISFVKDLLPSAPDSHRAQLERSIARA
ncbi:MAG: hypothetical protein A3B99_04580 [Candidatus Yanofskybacteria bacterium RIFCSPHIGHO2_02_FULL_44_12b]|uniref:Uncharacterized protein n=2 Tax=Candidatus Yanofskyibacteriota TaxID=1752733 RepID=A0A1F8GK72_9BACT|nr:MAG: hypothetical protein UW79_C0013G0055 [Candidatus Yanofskybacteria bacterium GW2011_GWA2_44_9]OGN04343.1 MAG: hypothetical protein A2659_03380 [Candidatus Yanofskybacteria bacterium RIFCSPHIGHO2_01_FULL_44_24]OGN14452.1 MAG: hypothetical protein A3B99_04580 [Candidatus Yanofskybacteria bacterium RIFCSPHIGHO2_02_FULL_44_12b]OGN25733.1 MAG: hypothetical protein A2925_00920 [Candidatus Yanofskybacteria bacterium RIFCSPLOWO2_01_FULL_44_22]